MSGFALPQSWFTSGDALVGVLGSIDRICDQFAIALQNAQHQHLFLVAALVGTIALVLPKHP